MARRKAGFARLLHFISALRVRPAIRGEACGPLLPPPATPAPVNGGWRKEAGEMNKPDRQSLYGEVTTRIIAELEEGRLPWVQPWDSSRCPCMMPCNAASGRAYSGINILILWCEAAERQFTSQHWLTYRQALAAGGNVRRGEKGTVVCYADRFTPKDEAEKAAGDDREARTIAFLKRFVVFNLDQVEGLPERLMAEPGVPDPVMQIAEVDRLIAASGADFRIGGDEAFYSPAQDYVQVPPQAAFHDPVNWFRTALHELGHWAGGKARLNRDMSGKFGSAQYAREELVAEMTAAFSCASLGIQPTVRHSDYLGAWLEVMRADEKAIFRAASAASKAADFLLAFAEDAA